MSLIKNVSIHERVTAQFRMDAFNALNHINFAIRWIRMFAAIDTTSSGSITGGPFRPDSAELQTPVNCSSLASAVLTDLSLSGEGLRLFPSFFPWSFKSGEERAGKSVPQGLRVCVRTYQLQT